MARQAAEAEAERKKREPEEEVKMRDPVLEVPPDS